VLGDACVSVHDLPDSGAVTVGRSPDCDICIDAPGVSRKHLLIRIAAEVTVEDLGATNGTVVQGERLERGVAATLSAGARIELPAATIVLQPRGAAARPRRIWLHEYFEARLEEECLRAERGERTFSLVRVRSGDRETRAHMMQELVLGALRSCDVVAAYAPNDYEVLLSDASPADTEAVLERLRDSLREVGLSLQLGAAHYPQDGRVPEALMARASAALVAADSEDLAANEVVVEAPVMRDLHRFVARVAAGEINTLILGETGVGKEIITERLHDLSPRVTKPLLRLNCAAFTESLLESELFGHERGAFTGATTAKTGLAMLLRCLEEGSVRRVGGVESRPIDIRIAAATHKDLEAEVARGTFRRDLFFRIAGVTVVVPPLRDRVEEIPRLADVFVRQACRRQRLRKSVVLSARALEWMCAYPWPGNIRELRNMMERAVLLSHDGVIRLEHLPAAAVARATRLQRETQGELNAPELELQPGAALPATLDVPTVPIARAIEPLDLRSGIKEREKALICDALARAAGNQTQAAKLLGISRRTLISRIEEYGLPRPRVGRRGSRS
jgi:DNA-binding NtrC family response regulator